MIDNSMMLSNTACSTLAILIACSLYLSLPSCVVTATGADFSAIIRLILAAKTLGNGTLLSVPISIGTTIGASGSASVPQRRRLLTTLTSQAIFSWASSRVQSDFLSNRVLLMMLVLVQVLLLQYRHFSVSCVLLSVPSQPTPH